MINSNQKLANAPKDKGKQVSQGDNFVERKNKHGQSRGRQQQRGGNDQEWKLRLSWVKQHDVGVHNRKKLWRYRKIPKG